MIDVVFDKGISVVVVNYRTPELLKDFVDAFYTQSSIVPTELIIIDVGMTGELLDQSKEILTFYRDKGKIFHYWPFFYNSGYAAACNFAATLSNKEVIAFFNADTILFDDTLDICYNYLMCHNDTAVCGPLQLNSSGQVTHAGILGSDTQPSLRGWKSSEPFKYRDNIDEVISVSGSAYFVKNQVWHEMLNCPIYRQIAPDCEGAFLPTPHFYEETFFSYHCRAHGYKVAYIGEAMMIHEWHQSSPVGGWAEAQIPVSQHMFREACGIHGIECD